MRYLMVDWQGRQVGNTEEAAAPLVEMAQQLHESNDLVIWAYDHDLVRRVLIIVRPDGKLAQPRVLG